MGCLVHLAFEPIRPQEVQLSRCRCTTFVASRFQPCRLRHLRSPNTGHIGWSKWVHHGPPWSTMVHHSPPWSTMSQLLSSGQSRRFWRDLTEMITSTKNVSVQSSIFINLHQSSRSKLEESFFRCVMVSEWIPHATLGCRLMVVGAQKMVVGARKVGLLVWLWRALEAAASEGAALAS